MPDAREDQALIAEALTALHVLCVERDSTDGYGDLMVRLARALRRSSVSQGGGDRLNENTLICCDHATVATPGCEHHGDGLATLGELIGAYHGDLSQGEGDQHREALEHRTRWMLRAAEKLRSEDPEPQAVANVLEREAHQSGGRPIRSSSSVSSSGEPQP